MRTYTADEVDEMIGRALAREREQRKPWVGLTEWERGDCVDRGVARGDGWAAILEEVEAKLREKNT